MSEPTTEAGRAAYNLIREPLIYGVRDRLDGNHSIVWAVRDGLIAAEAEARTAVLAELRAKVSDPERFGWSGPPTYAIAYAAAIRDILSLLDES